MAVDPTCGNCGTVLTNAVSADGTLNPCPACGSTNQVVALQAVSTAMFSVQANIEVISYPKNLLAVADALIEQSHWNIATVVGHMACEVATERAFDSAYSDRNIDDLAEAIEGLLPGYNMANDKIRKLYNAVTKKQIETEPFWKDFVDSSKRRNAIVHKSHIASEQEARATLDACRAFCEHLK